MLCASTIVIKAAILLTVSNRWDGDSRLSKGNKWASFPSVAAAWRISDEAFLKNVEALSNLKLRLVGVRQVTRVSWLTELSRA